MIPACRNRIAAQARTRETLVATATALFLRDGYAATSPEEVADEAGYSKGAVYSNFRNKDELCLAVVDAIRTDQAHRMALALECSRSSSRRGRGRTSGYGGGLRSGTRRSGTRWPSC